METVLTLVVGALLGASITYLLTKRMNADMKKSLYDSKLVNRFLKEYLHTASKKQNGKKKYYKNKRSPKAGTAGEQVAKPSKQQ